MSARLLALLVALLLCGCAGATDPAPPAVPVGPSEAKAQPPSGRTTSAATSDATQPTEIPAKKSTDLPGEVDHSCQTDADCMVKDIGNCCGYYPACVNRDSPTFPEQVKAQCAAEGISSVCGFPSVSGCQCIDHRCEAITGPGAGTVDER
jgi:hypothetical protein